MNSKFFKKQKETKMNRKNLFFVYASCVVLLMASACEETKPEPEPETPPIDASVTTVEGDITGNTTWKSTNKILLKGFVYVVDGATLTIEAGTVIKGDKNTKATLIIEPGGKIMAEGTKTNPIIFTSNQAAGQRDYGDWGGIIICGKADVNPPSQMTIEGGPRTKYGKGAGFTINNDDNSGVLKYVRVEFAGIEYATDNEINGITFGGVGRGTTIDYVQVSYCGDDSYEWFGGTVNCKHLIAFRGWDDEFDTDNGFSGKLQFVLGLRDPNVADKSKSNGFESDNDAGGSSNQPYTKPVFSNASMFGPYSTTSNITTPTGGNGTFQASMHLRRSTKLNVYNSVFAGWPEGLYVDGAAGDAQTHATNGELMVKNCILSGMLKNYHAAFDSTYFNRQSGSNSVYAQNSELKIQDPFNLHNPKFTLQSGSPLAGKSNLFSDAPLQDAFFDRSVNYIGAFGTEDWTSGWANFDPQNATYKW
ncbi:MAG: hypothetical protein LBQ64_04635 [Bacteroidales bacterium]|jgi:hypothetical protein|nr:hypothetical protein [Bacteroidales bacterium]